MRAALFCLTIAFTSLVGSAQGAIVLSMESGIFSSESGVRSLRISARTDANDVLTAFVTDVTLQAGNFADPVGTFMQAGQIGAGSTGVSSFTRSSATEASLSLDFNMLSNPPNFDQPFPATNGELATIVFDINGLQPGTYSINFSNSFAIDAQANFIDVFENSGSFTVTAVPEPSSMLLLGVTGGAFLLYRRWKHGGSIQTVA